MLHGNGAGDQIQLDVYGEIIDSIYLFDKYGSGISHGNTQAFTRLSLISAAINLDRALG